jgi:putative ATP-binding cassette transporter
MCIKLRTRIVLLYCVTFLSQLSFAQELTPEEKLDEIRKEISHHMDKGDIPGLGLVVIDGDNKLIEGYGYANVDQQQPVSDQTLFEIGSLSKAFTATALAQLVSEGRLSLDDPVSKYLPWFLVTFEGDPVEVTLGQLLYHTSGLPSSTISMIPESNDAEALEATVRVLIGQELDEQPGRAYQYATIGYDVLGLIIQQVSDQPFETYLEEAVFSKLALEQTSVSVPKDETLLAEGYKIGFFQARSYDAPRYRGNAPAGYVISNLQDMSTWLEFQLGREETELDEIRTLTHTRDKSVPLHQMSSYAGGWNVSLNGTGEIYHGGYNPNFTSYIAFRPTDQLGVVLLTNSNSTHTALLGIKIMKILAGETLTRELDPGDRSDGTYSGITIALAIYSIIVLVFLILVIVQAFQGSRTFTGITPRIVWRFFAPLFLLLPFAVGLYIFPEALIEFTWESVLVWSPQSFELLLYAIPAAVVISYVAYLVSLLFPANNRYISKAPQVLLISILSGLSNVAVIIMVTSVIGSDIDMAYLVYYYALVVGLYLLGRRFVQVNLIKLTRSLVYDLRVKLIEKVFSSSYERFEKVDKGRIYTALNDDVNTIGQSTNLFVTLVTSIITAVGAFIYLAALAFWATAITIFMILFLTVLYYLAVQRTNKYFEAARDSRNTFMRLIHGMIDGFKEVSLHRNKKIEYRDEVANSAREFKEKISTADIRFVNAFLVGESLLVVLLGLVSIGMSEMFPNIESFTIMSFVIVLLYLIGPVNSILGAVPNLMTLRIAWNRINNFIKEIPANLELGDKKSTQVRTVEKLEIHDVAYQYESKEGAGFGVGPINLEVNKGEILFIVGGNGSGKTTFAKLLTGLYKPHQGGILIDGKEVSSGELGEYYSVVFNPQYLFNRLYDIDVKKNSQVIKDLLETLNLGHKVKVSEEGTFSTTNLSGGQRKRLALLLCYLEDSPIFLFDEWAADQDPEYRKFFYRTLIPEMSKMGKIVIAITHDDHYFDIADRVVKMDQGQMHHGYEIPYSLEEAAI